MKKKKLVRSRKIANLVDNGILDYSRGFQARHHTRFGFLVFRQKAFPRFAVTKAQKQFNYFKNIVWDTDPVILEID